MNTKPTVSQIEFWITLSNGKTVTTAFLQKEKVNDLLSDPGSLGEYLRALAIDAGAQTEVPFEKGKIQ